MVCLTFLTVQNDFLVLESVVYPKTNHEQFGKINCAFGKVSYGDSGRICSLD